MKRKPLLASALLSTLFLPFPASSAQAPPLPKETKAQRDARMAWWRKARFGMFIHWGLYAIPAGVWKGKKIPGAGEWIMSHAKIPPSEYEKLAARFNPVKFDADRWAEIAKEAGMKYVVITTKHHDGFCLFDSKLTKYDVMDATPFKRDIMKELSEACARKGIRMCWYHSILDWHHPDYLPRRPWDKRPVAGHSLDKYIAYMKGQLRELLTNYGPIGVLWFDGGWEHTPRELHSWEIVGMIRSIQPKIIINNRLRIPQDFDTPEQHIPPTGLPGRDWETCMTMNHTWGYKKYDNDWKSYPDLLRKLVDIASKGGNFLLNVGPTAEGLIPEPSVERLLAMGKWLKKYGESIYGTAASPFLRLSWGRCTRKPGKLYLHVFRWPSDGRLLVPGLRNQVTSARVLGVSSGKALPLERKGDDWIVTLPPSAPDEVDSVVVLEIEGKPDVDAAIRPGPDGSVLLEAALAAITTGRPRYTQRNGMKAITRWTRNSEILSWKFRAKKAGIYRVAITYSCPKGREGTRYSLQVGGNILSRTVRATSSARDFRTDELGTVHLLEPGVYELRIVPVQVAKGLVMNFRSLSLEPLKE